MLIKKENLSGLNGEYQLCDPTELLLKDNTALEGIQETPDEENDETKRDGEEGENGEEKETEDQEEEETKEIKDMTKEEKKLFKRSESIKKKLAK